MEFEKNNLCRLCLKRPLKLFSVFEGSEIELSKLIYHFFDIEIKQNDPYSTQICGTCWYLIEAINKRRLDYCKNDTVLTSINRDTNILRSPKTKSTSAFHPSVSAIFQKYTFLHLKVEYLKMNFDAFVDLSICKLSPEIVEFFTNKALNLKRILHKDNISSAKIDSEQIYCGIPPGISIRRMSKSDKAPVRRTRANSVANRQIYETTNNICALSVDEVFGSASKYIIDKNISTTKPTPISRRRKTVSSNFTNSIGQLIKNSDACNIANENVNKPVENIPSKSKTFAKKLESKSNHGKLTKTKNNPTIVADSHNESVSPEDTYTEFDKTVQGLKLTLSSMKKISSSKRRRYSADPTYSCSEVISNNKKSRCHTPDSDINILEVSSPKRSRRSNKRRVMFGDPLTGQDADYYKETANSRRQMTYNARKTGITNNKVEEATFITNLEAQKGHFSNSTSVESKRIHQNGANAEAIRCPEDKWNNFFTENYVKVSDNIETSETKLIPTEEKLLFTTTLEQQVFICQLCDNVFDNQHTLKTHMKKHIRLSNKQTSMYSFIDVLPISLSKTKSIKY